MPGQSELEDSKCYLDSDNTCTGFVHVGAHCDVANYMFDVNDVYLLGWPGSSTPNIGGWGAFPLVLYNVMYTPMQECYIRKLHIIIMVHICFLQQHNDKMDASIALRWMDQSKQNLKTSQILYTIQIEQESVQGMVLACADQTIRVISFHLQK